MTQPGEQGESSQVSQPQMQQACDDTTRDPSPYRESVLSGSGVRRSSSRVSRMSRQSRNERRASRPSVEYDIPDKYGNLDELAAASPVQNPDEAPIYRHRSLEETRSGERGYTRSQTEEPGRQAPELTQEQEKELPQTKIKVSRLATQTYTISYLIFFSFMGTLARLGLQALTTYPGTPLIFPSIWPNFAGSLVMGFLAEDRMLFRFEWGSPNYEQQLHQAKRDEESGSGDSGRPTVDLAMAKKTYMATKKTIPLYIGLATGFCGSFTSFSSFIRDVFLALSNDLPTPGGAVDITSRNGGYSFMALLAVVFTTVSLSLSGIFVGAHLAIALEPITPSLPFLMTRKLLDRLVVFLAAGCWLGAILLSALPPDRNNGGPETWRGRATFALVFAPLGCLARFYASLYLNGKVAAFPLGTFLVNVLGTCILGMSWDIQHVPIGGVIGCQVLQGIEDGFCGCLTTVSTWASELAALRRLHAWLYGLLSVLVSLVLMIAIMGGLKWSNGYLTLQCLH